MDGACEVTILGLPPIGLVLQIVRGDFNCDQCEVTSLMAYPCKEQEGKWHVDAAHARECPTLSTATKVRLAGHQRLN